MQRALRGLLLLLVMLAAALPVRAGAAEGPGAGGAVSLSAEAGFDGWAKVGMWVPVVVTVTNQGEELEGALAFDVSTSWGQGEHRAVYRTPVVVPAGATKRVALLVPTELSGMPEIRLVRGERTLATVQPAVQLGRDVMVGVLGVEPAELPALGGLASGGRTVRLVRLTPERFPDEPLVLENLDALLLDRFAFGELPAPAQRALRGWVEHGGRLILAGGPEAGRLEGLSPWIPLSLEGTESVAVAGVGRAPLARLAVRPGDGWRVLWAQDGLPLTAQRQQGRGTVYFLAFDPALEPFSSWEGLPELFLTLLPAGGPFGMDPAMGADPKAQFRRMDGLFYLPGRSVPGVEGLLWVLAGYAVLVGPVHFLLLRGMRRLGWALLTLPALVLAGAGSAFAYMGQARASDVLVNALAVIEGQPGASTVRVQALAGIFMPPGSRHTAELGGGLLMPVAPPPRPRVEPGQPTRQEPLESSLELGRTAELLPAESWEARGLAAEAILPVEGTVSGTLVIADGKAQGRLTSHLPFALKDAVVVIGQNFQVLDLEPGQSVDVSLSLPLFTQVFQGGHNPLGELLHRVLVQQRGADRGPVQSDPSFRHREQMAWMGTMAVDWARAGRLPPVVLAGWAEYQPLPVTVDGRQAAASSTALYLQPVPVAFDDGALELPASFLQPRVVQWQGPVGMAGLMPGWSLGQGDYVTVEFAVPPELVARVTELTLRVPAMGRAPDGRYPLAFEFYRWSDGTWQPAAERADSVTLSAAEREAFLSPGGLVRVRLTQVGEDRFPMGVPGLSLRAGEVVR